MATYRNELTQYLVQVTVHAYPGSDGWTGFYGPYSLADAINVRDTAQYRNKTVKLVPIQTTDAVLVGGNDVRPLEEHPSFRKMEADPATLLA